MNWPLLLLIGYFGAIHAAPLPEDPLVDLDDYTVLYNGTNGSHYQSGEPGRYVKGIYTFLDSNGRKQQVTYEADARGYRVKTVAAGTQISNSSQGPQIKTEIKSVRIRFRGGQEPKRQELELQGPLGEVKPEPKSETKPETLGEIKLEPTDKVKSEPIGEVKSESVDEIKPETIGEINPEPTDKVKSEPVGEIESKSVDEIKPETIRESNAAQREFVSEKPTVKPTLNHTKERTPVAFEIPKVHLEPPPKPEVKAGPAQGPIDTAKLLLDDQKVTPQGTIRFKDPRQLQVSDDLGYFIGYPFVPGNYVYAL